MIYRGRSGGQKQNNLKSEQSLNLCSITDWKIVLAQQWCLIYFCYWSLKQNRSAILMHETTLSVFSVFKTARLFPKPFILAALQKIFSNANFLSNIISTKAHGTFKQELKTRTICRKCSTVHPQEFLKHCNTMRLWIFSFHTYIFSPPKRIGFVKTENDFLMENGKGKWRLFTNHSSTNCSRFSVIIKISFSTTYRNHPQSSNKTWLSQVWNLVFLFMFSKIRYFGCEQPIETLLNYFCDFTYDSKL